MEILVDIKNTKRDKKNIGLSWNVSINERQEGWVSHLPFVRKHQHIEKILALGIKNIFVSEEIRCKKEDLFVMVYNGIEYKQKDFSVSIIVDQNQIPFQVFIDTESIFDCKESQQRQAKHYSISFDFVLTDEKGVEVDIHHENIDIKFAPLDISPEIKLDLDKSEIQYSSQLGEEKIGEVVAWIEESYDYTPCVELNLELKVFRGKEQISDLVYFKEIDSSPQIKKCWIEPSRKELKRFSVYLDFNKISNPIEQEMKLTIERHASFAMAYSPEIIQPLRVEMDNLVIKKDLQGTELKVAIVTVDDGTKLFVKNSVEHSLPLMGFLPCSRMTSQIAIAIMNIATDSSNDLAGLVIKNLTLEETTRKDVRIERNDNTIVSVTTVDGDCCEEMKSNEGFFIKNGEDAETILYVSFVPSNITSVLGTSSDYVFQIESLLSFDYWENKNGVDLTLIESKKFKIPLIWNLRLEPYPEWLCVDYGSSAIVCKYDKELIDLKSQKDKIFKSDYQQFREDDLETGTKFLSSDVLLHTIEETGVTSLCSEQKERQPYNTLSICLSPTSSLIVNEVKTQLPYLKILVGNTFLPKKVDYMTFQYPRLDKQNKISKIAIKDSKDEEKSLLRISSIFEESYSALFKYFISPISGESRHLNKLVLTYPNTYTPVHLNVIRKIVSSTFPYIREGYLKFVSESDAVAAYYVDHWDEFNAGKNIFDSETVLVYDMGAGTLDITIFDKFQNKEGKLEINIKGKLGTGKAGNYLDFIIAEVLCDVLNINSAEIASTTQVSSVQVLKERLHMKQVIKSTIKPNLKEGVKTSYTVGNKEYSVSSDVIIKHPKFITFLDEVTNGILNQLKKYMDLDNLSIDTVILSGRSCKLQLLCNALKCNLEKYNKKDIYFVDFEGGSIPDRQKAVVVEGAVAQASKFDLAESEVKIKSRRLYASYGLIYEGLGGSYKYVELLSHNDVPFMDVTGTYDGKNVTVEGTASTRTIKLIQSYMSAEETEKNYNQNREFISDMEEYDMADFGNVNKLNVKLRLDKDNNIALFVNGRVSIGSVPKGVDLTSEITKRSIWPVTI